MEKNINQKAKEVYWKKGAPYYLTSHTNPEKMKKYFNPEKAIKEVKLKKLR